MCDGVDVCISIMEVVLLINGTVDDSRGNYIVLGSLGDSKVFVKMWDLGRGFTFYAEIGIVSEFGIGEDCTMHCDVLERHASLSCVGTC